MERKEHEDTNVLLNGRRASFGSLVSVVTSRFQLSSSVPVTAVTKRNSVIASLIKKRNRYWNEILHAIRSNVIIRMQKGIEKLLANDQVNALRLRHDNH
jgi:hypothetical protein